MSAQFCMAKKLVEDAWSETEVVVICLAFLRGGIIEKRWGISYMQLVEI